MDAPDLLAPTALLVSIDDTDTVDSEYGTGRISRFLADHLESTHGALQVAGSVRQQLLVDPRVPYTTHNSAACLICEWPADRKAEPVIETAASFLADIAAEGSDPGLCVGRVEDVTPAVTGFGRDAGEVVLEEASAYDRADGADLFLEEYGGTGEGVIGALAAVGRTATGDLGRLIRYDSIRSFEGVVDVETLREHEIRVVDTEGQSLETGLVRTGGWVRPSFRDGRATLAVEREEAGATTPGTSEDTPAGAARVPPDAAGTEQYRPANLDH